jgi:(4S)-4-hydroxy-5-phosphonooxypentane-2,3-dione isomerase
MPRPNRANTIVMLSAAAALAAAALPPHPLAAAEGEPRLMYVVDLDIAPAVFDQFMAALKENAAASMADPGCRSFSIAASKNDPHHIVLIEVYDDEAALEAHRATDHFKKYMATTGPMVAKREARAFAPVAMYAKAP